MKLLIDEQLLEKARQIGPLLRKNAKQADRENRLPGSSIEALREAGFFRLYFPKALGGLEVSPLTLSHIVEELARHDVSAAFLVAVLSTMSWHVGHLPTDTIREVYGENPDQIVVGANNPPLKIKKVDGGFLLSGRCPLVSFVSDAKWVYVLGAKIQNEGSETTKGTPSFLECIFPIEQAKVMPTWDGLGLRGVDSSDLILEDVFVPQERSFRPGIDRVQNPLYKSPLYQQPFIIFIASTLPEVILGMAQEAIAEFLALAGEKKPFYSSTRLCERGVAQSKLGKALGLFRSTRAYLYESLSEFWERGRSGEGHTFEQKTELFLASIHTVQICWQVVEMMTSALGSTGLNKNHRLEQIFRDAYTLHQHGSFSESQFEVIAQAWMGLKPDINLLTT